MWLLVFTHSRQLVHLLLPEVEVRKSEGQAHMQQQHVCRHICDGVQGVEGQWEEGGRNSSSKLDGQVHKQYC